MTVNGTPMTPTEPNQERIRRFVAALRSGKLAQTTGRLHRLNYPGQKEGFCCLGVACEVAIEDGLELDTATSGGVVQYGGSRQSGYLPTEVMNWYGFDTRDPYLKLPGRKILGRFVWWRLFWQPKFVLEDRKVKATVANDEFKMSFKQIADGFEREYLTPTKNKNTNEGTTA